MSNISVIPKPDTPQALARKYMLGQLAAKDYADKPGGLYQLMRMADNTKAVGAAEKALKQLTDLAKLHFEQDTTQVHEIKLVEIGNVDGKIVEIESA